MKVYAAHEGRNLLLARFTVEEGWVIIPKDIAKFRMTCDAFAAELNSKSDEDIDE